MNLIIDVGNTNVKAAVFKQDTLVKSFVFDKKIIISEIKKILKKHAISSAIIASVASITHHKLQKLQKLLPLLVVSSNINVPFINLYKTPNTLGVDRIGLVVAALKKYPKQNVLIIDAGSCVTFDFINKKGEYLGGAISPGINMRYKALHTFTANLPYLNKEIPESAIGKTTHESIHAGIIQGVINELEGSILTYKEKFKDLTVVLTGGDTNFLSKQLKSGIFANQNFLLLGLNELLIFNKDK
ncbi:type III pantothenate kinase [Polaribacter sp.]|uniref:type III pantothenate kinase n=1 Tax=Polaribacter sp. TaxID=1920175 RepID=UPI003EF95329